jgi:prophage regulatory protein
MAWARTENGIDGLFRCVWMMGVTQPGDTMNNQTVFENRIIRCPEVMRLSGLSRSALDREVRAGRFPAPVKLSTDPRCRAVGWSWRAVQSWISERENAQRAAA